MKNNKLVVKILRTILSSVCILTFCFGGCKSGDKKGEITPPVTPDPIRPNQPTNTSAIEVYEGYLKDLDTFPVSFKYNGVEYRGLKNGFTLQNGIETKDETIYGQKVKRTELQLLHNESNVLFTVDTACYPDYNAYEWTISLKNTGKRNTEIFSDFNSADVYFKGDNPEVIGISGDLEPFYDAYNFDLTKSNFTNANYSGRPTHGDFPYYNLAHGNGGTMIAVGWPGRWRAGFAYDKEQKATRFTSGLTVFESYLKSGESVRFPLQAFVGYEGRDTNVATNAWRKWYIDCNMPHTLEGEKISTVLGTGAGPNYITQGLADSENVILNQISEALEHGLNIENMWIDAGWYTTYPGNQSVINDNWPSVGTFEINNLQFPNKFKNISDKMHSIGGTTLVWFEPEVNRVANIENFLKNQEGFDAGWLMGKVSEGSWLEGQLLNLGIEECVNYVMNKVGKILIDGDVDVYREDFNSDPATAWDRADTLGRVGITENKWVVGLLKFWDGILEMKPGLLIDSCASGGGRNDLESLRRAVPLHYSDTYADQGQNKDGALGCMQSLYQWFPMFKNMVNGTDEADVYKRRATYSPWTCVNTCTGSQDYTERLKVQEEFNLIRNYYYGNYYQLLEGGRTDKTWKGWEFIDPNTQEGFIQAFRPSGATQQPTVHLKFYDLDSTHLYHVYDLDGFVDVNKTGEELMTKGINLTLPNVNTSAIILIKK